MPLTDTPYLSVVVTTRNDDHGGDPLRRLQAFINTFDAQCRRTGLDAETVVVEWNPPPDRPRLYDLIRVPASCAFAIRFVEVPSELHSRLRHADVLPLFQMIAKNVGIRRARGRFILATNIDIIFSNELVEYLASGQLASGYRYRVNRHDIESDYPVDGSLAEQMAYCQMHQLRLHTRSGTHHVDARGRIRAFDADILGSAGIALGRGWHVREGDATSGFFRWAAREACLVVDPTTTPALGRGARLEIEAGPNPYQPDSWVELEILEGERRLARRRLSARTRFRIALDDVVAPRELVMRMVDSSGGREWLPLFERRETLCYRVHRMKVTDVPTHSYDMALWQRASDSTKLSLKQTPDGVEITTDPGKYSYCARYGPFESPTDGRYEFELQYSTEKGNFGLNVMDDARQCWLPSVVAENDEGEFCARTLSVEVPRQTRFSIYVSNHRPGGDAVSRFLLRSLGGSVPLDQLICKSGNPGPARDERRVRRVKDLLSGLHRQFRSRAASLALRRARERFESRIVVDSERVQELETRLRSLTPLNELASVERLLREYRPVELHQNASGDFQLLARDHWFELRGFAEFCMYSMNIDGLFETVAHYGGIKEQLLEEPLCAYHLEHEKGSGWTPEGEALLKRRMAESGITWLDAGVVHIWGSYMHWLERPMIFNGSNWGFGDVELPEMTFQNGGDHA
jgi:hypothetical protein